MGFDKEGFAMCHSAVVCASSRCYDFGEQVEESDVLRRQSAQRLSDGSMVIALRMVQSEVIAGLNARKALCEAVEAIDRILANLKDELGEEGDY